MGQGASGAAASVTPLLGYVRSIETAVVDAAEPSAAPVATMDVSGSDPVLVDAAARLAERRFSPR